MRILGVDITEKNKIKILDEFSNQDKGYICVTSVHGLIEAWENNDINIAFQNSFVNVPDGMPLVYWGKYLKNIQIERITGPEFIYDFLNWMNKSKSSLSTIGGNIESINKFVAFLNKNYPEISFESFNTDFIDINKSDDLQKIEIFLRNLKSDYVFVFLSTPKQDLLMYKMNSVFNNLKFVGFGAALDYVNGDIKYCPKILQKLSLEWLYRLFQEPKRLYKRYLNIVPKFFLYNFFNLFSRR